MKIGIQHVFTDSVPKPVQSISRKVCGMILYVVPTHAGFFLLLKLFSAHILLFHCVESFINYFIFSLFGHLHKGCCNTPTLIMNFTL